MRNRYPGTCYRCGKTVLAGQGYFERFDRNNKAGWTDAEKRSRWRVQHVACAKIHRATATHFILAPKEAHSQ